MPVELTGATGPNAELVIGTYTPTEERRNGKTMFTKLGDASKCLYLATDKRWWVSKTADVIAGTVRGFAHTGTDLSHPTLAKKWHVSVDGSLQLQSVVASVMVSL